MADTKTCNRKPRRRRTPPNIEVHWNWPDLPGLSQEEADRLGEVAMRLVARRLVPLLAKQVARDLLREEQARVRPPTTPDPRGWRSQVEPTLLAEVQQSWCAITSSPGLDAPRAGGSSPTARRLT